MNETPLSSAPPSRWLRKLILLGLLGGGLVWGGRVVQHLLTHEETDDAYVTGSIHTISSRLAGVVSEILVEENTRVKAGQPLIKLDTRDLDLKIDGAKVALQRAQAQLAQSEARLADTKAQGDIVHAGVDLAAANVARDQAHVAKAKIDLDRADALKSKGELNVISQADYDTAKSAFTVASATLEATRASADAAKSYITSAKAKLKAAEAELEAAKAEVRSAEFAIRDAELQLSYATITAPADGTLSRKAVEIGNRIQPGQALFALVDPKVWIQANFKETQIGKLHVGQEVEVVIDALPKHQLTGRIASFSAASGAQFSLLPPDNATGNFTKVVQRVPVRIEFDDKTIADVREQIRPGLSVLVSIEVK
jgi:membrane fusion protein (multidrug efflux system)